MLADRFLLSLGQIRFRSGLAHTCTDVSQRMVAHTKEQGTCALLHKDEKHGENHMESNGFGKWSVKSNRLRPSQTSKHMQASCGVPCRLLQWYFFILKRKPKDLRRLPYSDEVLQTDPTLAKKPFHVAQLTRTELQNHVKSVAS